MSDSKDDDRPSRHKLELPSLSPKTFSYDQEKLVQQLFGDRMEIDEETGKLTDKTRPEL